jgi:hypothetical protein
MFLGVGVSGSTHPDAALSWSSFVSILNSKNPYIFDTPFVTLLPIFIFSLDSFLLSRSYETTLVFSNRFLNDAALDTYE